MMRINKQKSSRLLALQDFIYPNFTKSDWIKLGYLTNCHDIVEGHPRLLRSLDFRDEDYEGNCLQTLAKIIDESSGNALEIERYIADKKIKLNNGAVHDFASTVRPVEPARVITFAPDVFQIPDKSVEVHRLSVMMPFDGKFSGTYAAIRNVCSRLSIECKRADDIWDNSILIQDVFDLIYTSRVVITDFTDRNPNVFYETGIAHTLGKIVIPITQAVGDIPFDLRHHRALTYLGNSEGLAKLERDLEKKLMMVFQ